MTVERGRDGSFASDTAYEQVGRVPFLLGDVKLGEVVIYLPGTYTPGGVGERLSELNLCNSVNKREKVLFLAFVLRLYVTFMISHLGLE